MSLEEKINEGKDSLYGRIRKSIAGKIAAYGLAAGLTFGALSYGCAEESTASNLPTSQDHTHDAKVINYDNTISGLSANNVQEAIDEDEGRVNILESAIEEIESGLNSIQVNLQTSGLVNMVDDMSDIIGTWEKTYQWDCSSDMTTWHENGTETFIFRDNGTYTNVHNYCDVTFTYDGKYTIPKPGTLYLYDVSTPISGFGYTCDSVIDRLCYPSLHLSHVKVKNNKLSINDGWPEYDKQ